MNQLTTCIPGPRRSWAGADSASWYCQIHQSTPVTTATSVKTAKASSSPRPTCPASTWSTWTKLGESGWRSPAIELP